MDNRLDNTAQQRLSAIFDQGAAAASDSLSRWLGQPALLRSSQVEEVDLLEASELLGPAEQLVVACSMALEGRITGILLLIFEDRSGLALADLLLRQPEGTAKTWGDLERSAAMETANIVVCAYLNALASQLPRADEGTNPTIQPTPPAFRHEYAGCLLEFALMDQAFELDRILVVRTQFEVASRNLDWSLLLVPSRTSLSWLASGLRSE